MDKISKIKTDLRMREWAEMVRECSRSGLTIREWCGDNGINIKTYYYRLKSIRSINPRQKSLIWSIDLIRLF